MSSLAGRVFATAPQIQERDHESGVFLLMFALRVIVGDQKPICADVKVWRRIFAALLWPEGCPTPPPSLLGLSAPVVKVPQELRNLAKETRLSLVDFPGYWNKLRSMTDDLAAAAGEAVRAHADGIELLQVPSVMCALEQLRRRADGKQEALRRATGSTMLGAGFAKSASSKSNWSISAVGGPQSEAQWLGCYQASVNSLE